MRKWIIISGATMFSGAVVVACVLLWTENSESGKTVGPDQHLVQPSMRSGAIAATGDKWHSRRATAQKRSGPLTNEHSSERLREEIDQNDRANGAGTIFPSPTAERSPGASLEPSPTTPERSKGNLSELPPREKQMVQAYSVMAEAIRDNLEDCDAMVKAFETATEEGAGAIAAAASYRSTLEGPDRAQNQQRFARAAAAEMAEVRQAIRVGLTRCADAPELMASLREVTARAGWPN